MRIIEVSVLVITYNQRNYIEKCLDSILSQETHFGFEILIHDDASTDGTQDIINSYLNKYENIKAVLQTENQFSKGKVHPDEALFSLVQGKYTCIVEGDDCWCDNTKLQKQYEALESHADCSMCVHKFRLIDSNGTDLDSVKGDYSNQNTIITSDKLLNTYFVNNIWAFQTSTFFMRSNILLNRPDFWDKFYVGDLPTILWFAHNGAFYYIDEVMSCYRVFAQGSATNQNRQRDYAIRKAKTNAEGLIAFNEYTNCQHWKYLKHITSYYVYQYFSATRKILSNQYLDVAKKELSITEKISAKIKYTKVGYWLRNIREDIRKARLKVV